MLTGSTFHIVPAEGGGWQVVDPMLHVSTFPSRSAAEHHAKEIAAVSQPSQVVLFDTHGRVVPIARYQLPEYPAPYLGAESHGSPFEAAVKALVISGLVAAGAKVLGDLVTTINQELEREKSKVNRPKRRRR